MSSVKFRGLHVREEQRLVDIGGATAVRPESLVKQIRQKRDAGEIEIEQESEVWILPENSMMARAAVPTKSSSRTEDGREIHYKKDDDFRFGDTYVGLERLSEKVYRIDGYVKAIKPEMAARVVANLRGGRMDAKKIVLVNDQTISRFTVKPQ
ncbi:MAG: hypothetical protein ABEK59_05980 [Halobacteria archaeon]